MIQYCYGINIRVQLVDVVLLSVKTVTMIDGPEMMFKLSLSILYKIYVQENAPNKNNRRDFSYLFSMRPKICFLRSLERYAREILYVWLPNQ